MNKGLKKFFIICGKYVEKMFHMWYDNLSYLIEQILGGTKWEL